MDYQTLIVEMKYGIGLVWLNRPKAQNALNETMVAEMSDALRRFNEDSSVRTVVIAGKGDSFCADADRKEIERMAGRSFRQNCEEAMNFATLLHLLDTLKKPTVARVHGFVSSAGVGLVAACDMAVGAYDAEFRLSEVRLGLIPSTIGPYVVRAMGERAARHLILSAESFTGAEAYRLGLLSDIAPPEELDSRINELLGQLIQGGPAAQTLTKEWFRNAAGLPLTAELIKEGANTLAKLQTSEEVREGIAALIEKRKPSWLREKKTTTRKAAVTKTSRRK
jgi:methylglutaconyl-CoA hydratase